MFCAYCGTKLEEGSKFCLNCGNAVADVKEESVSNVESFEAENATKLEQVANEPMKTEPVEPDKPVNITKAVEPVRPVKPEKPVELTKPVEEKPMEPDQPVEPQQTTEPEVTSGGFCANCGASLEAGAKFCFSCGCEVVADEEESANTIAMNTETLNAETNSTQTPEVHIEQPINTTINDATIPGQAAQIQPTQNEYQAPLSVPQENKKKEKKKKDKPQKEGKKSKKGLVAAIIIIVVLALGAGGYTIFTKITLGKLSDSVETFKTLVQDNGLSKVQEYATLIEDAEDLAGGFNVFGASKMEDRLEQATADCNELSAELLALKAQRANYENLDQKMILDDSNNTYLQELLTNFDTAIEEGNKENVETALNELASLKDTIQTDNRVYIESLLDEAKGYENPDFGDEEYNTLNNQITLTENYVTAGEFVKAKDEALNCSVLITELEAKVIKEKEEAAFAALYAKPETLTVMIADCMYSESADRRAFEEALEEKLGMDIIFTQMSDDDYYNAVDSALTGSNLPDVVYLSQDMYKEFASDGYLADITDYWNESELVTKYNYFGQSTMDHLKIDGRLYGFTPERGYTSVTYVHQSWLDQLGIAVPTNYDEFAAMLKAFTDNKMGNTSRAEDTFGMTAPGIIYNSEPYVMFLQEFYQDGYPELIQNSYGEWIDGFTQQSMIDALYRLQEAYANGSLDPNIANNSISDALDAFASGKCGAISLWEGDGADYIVNAMADYGFENDVIVLNPIAENGCYIGREPEVFAVTTACEHPAGVMKYFFEPMLDGGEVQRLWTYGVKGVHWNDIAETVAYDDGSVVEYQNGEFHMLPTADYSYRTYTFNYIDPLRALASFTDGVDGMNSISEAARQSTAVAEQFYTPSPYVKYSDSYWYYFSDIHNARINAINSVVFEGVDPIEAIETYQLNAGSYMNEVLNELNQ